jgi:hypothetical protein
MMMRKRKMETNKDKGEEKLKKIAINENILMVAIIISVAESIALYSIYDFHYLLFIYCAAYLSLS